MDYTINYNRVESAIKYLIENFRKQPSLDQISQVVGLSPFHFQRIFTEWAGVSPKQFLNYLTVEALKTEIAHTHNLIEASSLVGLSSQSRAYDLMVHIEAMTPGEYKTQGKGLLIEYGFAETPFGKCLVASTARGICAFQFIDGNEDEMIVQLHKDWIYARCFQNNDMAENVVKIIFNRDAENLLHVCLQGTPFQIKVWKALVTIPSGSLITYSDVAQLIQAKSATRAVATAIANNPVGLIIPCHRVIRREGMTGQYHWKPERKASIIGWEFSQKQIADKTNKHQ